MVTLLTGMGSKFCRVDRQQTLRLITKTDRDSDSDTTIIETSNQTGNVDGLLIASPTTRGRVGGCSFIMNKHFSRDPLNSNGRTTEFPWLPKLWKKAVAAGYGKWWFAARQQQPAAGLCYVA